MISKTQVTDICELIERLILSRVALSEIDHNFRTAVLTTRGEHSDRKQTIHETKRTDTKLFVSVS
jgi:hypothetical protein